MMNFGARNNDSKNYDKNAMLSDVSPEKLDNPNVKNMILNDLSSAFNWYNQRGNAGDNVDIDDLDQFHHHILNDNAEKATEYAHSILETQMHPTAEDICKAPIKQFCYNVLGKRAYKYELEE